MTLLHMHTVCPPLLQLMAMILTVQVGVQPEDAGVGVSKGPAQTAAALLPPLLLQPPTVRHARLLVHLEAPEKHTRRQELCFGDLCRLS